ncbi:hypothetical protein PMI04_011695 [Sphingobium sp. AP49]|uniref:hypothetical protein n=1 Tax=Sphingobium sp. AP49 TaxID=1144307 RepID=UPI00026ED512|nr:hypothetical protein [Sphingobium sp. AP49]WHO37235.1 hypothetical protein PMI04_011695 [Sphingobium sp. AP49]
MPILNLAKLKPGDILLESGMPKIASNTGTENQRFGHASLVLNQLIFIHSPGPGERVSLGAFHVSTWSDATGQRILGHKIADPAKLLRPFDTPDTSLLIGRVAWELGFPYANIEKLKALIDLSSEGRELLDSKVVADFFERTRRKVEVASDGRSCGELVARILFPEGPAEISPNTLGELDGLTPVVDAITDEFGFSEREADPVEEKVNDLLARYDQMLTRNLWTRVKTFIGKEMADEDIRALAADIEQALIASQTNNSKIILDIDRIAKSLFC